MKASSCLSLHHTAVLCYMNTRHAFGKIACRFFKKFGGDPGDSTVTAALALPRIWKVSRILHPFLSAQNCTPGNVQPAFSGLISHSSLRQ